MSESRGNNGGASNQTARKLNQLTDLEWRFSSMIPKTTS